MGIESNSYDLTVSSNNFIVELFVNWMAHTYYPGSTTNYFTVRRPGFVKCLSIATIMSTNYISGSIMTNCDAAIVDYSVANSSVFYGCYSCSFGYSGRP